MRRNEKRTAHGTLKPNLYFLLQLSAVMLLLSIFMQLAEWFKFGDVSIFIACFASIFPVMYFLVKRKRAIQRQDNYHLENQKS